MGRRAADSSPGRARVGISRTQSLMGPTAQSSRTAPGISGQRTYMWGGAHSYSRLYILPVCGCCAYYPIGLDYQCDDEVTAVKHKNSTNICPNLKGQNVILGFVSP